VSQSTLTVEQIEALAAEAAVSTTTFLKHRGGGRVRGNLARRIDRVLEKYGLPVAAGGPLVWNEGVWGGGYWGTSSK
jgi:hypothetical protein